MHRRADHGGNALCCRFCSARLSPERAEIYAHCPKDDCVTIWRRERLQSYALALVPKSGFQIVSRNDSFLKAAKK